MNPCICDRKRWSKLFDYTVFSRQEMLVPVDDDDRLALNIGVTLTSDVFLVLIPRGSIIPALRHVLLTSCIHDATILHIEVRCGLRGQASQNMLLHTVQFGEATVFLVSSQQQYCMVTCDVAAGISCASRHCPSLSHIGSSQCRLVSLACCGHAKRS